MFLIETSTLLKPVCVAPGVVLSKACKALGMVTETVLLMEFGTMLIVNVVGPGIGFYSFFSRQL